MSGFDEFLDYNGISDYDIALLMVGLSDVDGDHLASPEEIIDMYAEFGVTVTPEEDDAFIDEADTNDDG